MKDNSKRITISLSASAWSHCFVGIEENLESVYTTLILKDYKFNSDIINQPETSQIWLK